MPLDCRTNEVAEPATEYRQLRNEREQSSGEEWIDDLDNFGGRLHVVMTQLGEILGQTRCYSRTDVIQLLGEPDAIREEGGKVSLIYFWRGWHDYLYFTCRGDVLLGADWYFALE
jgi:hypothetical protein